MSKTITVRAADSGLAMDEVVRQLGPEALILSTSRRGGLVEIKATLEAEEAVPARRKDAAAVSVGQENPILETSPSTFEALLKRRLEEDKVEAVVEAAMTTMEETKVTEPEAVVVPMVAPERRNGQPRVTGLGAFDIPIPELPGHVIEAVREDLDYFDRSHQLIGLSKAIVSSIIPVRVTEALGAGRFWLAGPDMRQKALAAIRLAMRKMDAGEAKPSFYVMGSEARADAAFLASKAELLGLTVSLVDESVGRNLPDNVPGSQIVLLPDDADKAREYATKFQHDGDKGLLVLPSIYGRRRLEQVLNGWSGMDVQLMLCNPEKEPIPAELVACLLQFNWQVAWISQGDAILDNLDQVNAETVTGWMRGWIDAPEEDSVAPQAAPLFHSRQSKPRQEFE